MKKIKNLSILFSLIFLPFLLPAQDKAFFMEQKEVIEQIENDLNNFIRRKENALERADKASQDTQMIDLINIENDLLHIFEEEKMTLELHEDWKRTVSIETLPQEFNEREHLIRLAALNEKILMKRYEIDFLLKSRKIALNSDFSIAESTKALNWIQKSTKELNTLYKTIEKEGAALLARNTNMHTQEAIKNKIDAINAFLTKTQNNIKDAIKSVVTNLSKQWGFHHRLYETLELESNSFIEKTADLQVDLKQEIEFLKEKLTTSSL